MAENHSSRPFEKTDLASAFGRLLHERDTRCMIFSTLLHGTLILLLSIFILPASGRPDANLLNVSFSHEMGEKADPNDIRNKDVPEEKEIDTPWEETSEETLNELKDSFRMEDEDAREYLKDRQEKIAQKKKNLAQYAQKHKNIAQSVQNRSRYGTLQPRTFYGVQLFSRKMVFLLDVSGSMDIEEARAQLKNAYRSLNATEYFNLIVYASTVIVWKNALALATEENKKNADAWVDTITSGGATNIHGALEKAFEVAYQKTRAETLYFLSDGLPTAGRVQQPTHILASVKRWNRDKQVVIHTIGIGPHQDRQFLSALAEENNGRYHVR